MMLPPLFLSLSAPALGLTALLLLAGCGGSKSTTTVRGEHPTEISDNAQANTNRAKVTAAFMAATRARLIGDLPNAAKLFEECLKMDPQNAAAMFELSKIYHGAQQFDRAMELAKGAVAIDKENVWYQFLLADLLQQNNQPEEAVKIYRTITQKWPENYETWFDLAHTLAFLGKVDEAQQVFRDLEKRIGSSDELVMEEYGMLAQAGKTAEAKTLLENQLAKNPDNPQYHGMLGELLEQMGDNEGAVMHFNKVLELDPSNSMARLALAEHYTSSGDFEKAYEQLSLVFGDADLEIDPKMGVLLGFYENTRATGSGNSDQETMLKKAYDLIDVLQRTHPESGKPYTIRGDFYLRDGKLLEARDEFRKAVNYEQDKFPIWQQLVQLDFQLRDYPGTHDDASKAIELFPTVPYFFLLNGLALNNLKRSDEAVETLIAGRDLVVDDKPTLAQFWSSIGEAHNDAKRYPQSDEAFDQALKLQPDDANALNNWAYYLSVRNEQLDKAERMSKRSNELQPGQASYEDTYAWILYQMGRYVDARVWIEKAMANGGAADGVVVEHYGDILFKLGEPTAALDQWKKAQGLAGASDELGRKVSEGRLPE
ncbi:MAG: tetratricopeptide repeat protein [Flavobacteriales bacterium]|nr:tetratricopeptide repeat protein [Flavobacteriales bacterium]MBK9193872.1 tetratricopeptide repeat protein [Flavobacteriales bacterium]